MALQEAEGDIVKEGDGCSTRARYRVTPEDLKYISDKLDKIDGDNPFVTFKLEAVQRTLGGGTNASAGCVAWYLNRKISSDEKLASTGVYAHTDDGDIRFDYNAPTKQEAEPPSS